MVYLMIFAAVLLGGGDKVFVLSHLQEMPSAAACEQIRQKVDEQSQHSADMRSYCVSVSR